MMIIRDLQDVQEKTLTLPVHILAALNSRLTEIPQQMAPVPHNLGNGPKPRHRRLSKIWQPPSVQYRKVPGQEIVDPEPLKTR